MGELKPCPFCGRTDTLYFDRYHMTNQEWIDLLSKQFNVSRTSARDMLHALMKIKRYDNFKKTFNRDMRGKK